MQKTLCFLPSIKKLLKNDRVRENTNPFYSSYTSQLQSIHCPFKVNKKGDLMSPPLLMTTDEYVGLD